MKLGFIGLGNIGSAIVANLLADGHDVSVFDLERARLEEAAASGARAGGDVAEVSASSEITFLSLPGPDVVDAVAAAWLAAAPGGSILVDLSTNAPARVKALAEKV